MKIVNKIKASLSNIFHHQNFGTNSSPITVVSTEPVSEKNPLDEIEQNPDEYGCPI